MPAETTGDDAQNLHEQGVLLVAERLRQRGFNLESVARDHAYDPQIVAVRRGRKYHFVVRTAWWPRRPKLECPELRGELRAWALRHAATCLMVQVTLRPETGASSLKLRFRRI